MTSSCLAKKKKKLMTDTNDKCCGLEGPERNYTKRCKVYSKNYLGKYSSGYW